MLWVGGEGRRAFRIDKSLEKLGWLDLGQVAAKASILTAMKVIHSNQQNNLQEKIVRIVKKIQRQIQ